MMLYNYPVQLKSGGGGLIMKEVSYSEARQNLASILSAVCDNNVPIYIRRKNGQKAVIISAEEYESMDETSYLLRSEANRRYLLESVKQADNEETVSFEELTGGY
ncbi:MAG: type II toxin-antitoxin system prevent-host-death family antitoxin [Holosporales bacterium]|jgi:antitoxin YefM|nr:type II toxin-antitoxin system prevent-host-death family antitoxin [Holosporales bacterium]